MANKHLTDPPSAVLLQRLTVLLEDVNDAYKSNRMVLEQDLINLYHQAMDTAMAT